MTEVMRKYSKPSKFYLGTKKDFFTDNAALLSKALEQNNLYGKQPQRGECKICLFNLPTAVDFSSHGICYKFCEKCSHLNGTHEDTKNFVDKLYISDDGSDYSSAYIDDGFVRRAMDIYIPKVDFLSESLGRADYTMLDVGCGSGYFVHSALHRGIGTKGLDVSKSMVDFGNSQISHNLGKTPLSYVDETGFYDAIVNSTEDVISAIGVIEHLREPHRFFNAFQKSSAEYLYYSVPMFSNTVYFEVMRQDVFPRQLSGGHTHLFVEESIKKMNSIIGVSPVAEWRFGTDVMDLYRMMMNHFNQIDVSDKFIQLFEEGFNENIDSLQSVFDESHFCSEIHLVARKIKN
jgi:SAM-dependent methyltransferase